MPSSFRIYDPPTPIPGSAPNIGASGYIPNPRVRNAVNAAFHARQPLLVTGEPGVGKTVLAESIAHHLGRRLYTFAVKSDSRGRDAVYRFEHLERMYDAFRGNARADNPRNYLHYEGLGKALQDEHPAVVLVDELDKAPRDFPNDLLLELDRGQIQVPEVGGEPVARRSLPFVLVTSNEERDIPEPFLRRCAFVRVPFPTREEIELIARVRLGHDAEALVGPATARFLALREQGGARWRKSPSTSELLAWLLVLQAAGTPPDAIEGDSLENLFPQVLVKTREDLVLCGLPAD